MLQSDTNTVNFKLCKVLCKHVRAVVQLRLDVTLAC